MNRIQKYLVLIAIVCLAVRCDTKNSFAYKHAEKEQVIACDGGVDTQLLNEALYTFEDDLIYAYAGEENQLSTAYGRFLYSGFAGTAMYEQFASDHAISVKKALIKAGIIIEGGLKSNLNYNHPSVQCILENIEDTEMKLTINALVDTNTMDPKLLSGRMRNFGRNAAKYRYEALYVALDTYYQQITVARPTKQVNE